MPNLISRRRFHKLILGTVGLPFLSFPSRAARSLPKVQAYRNPSCGCCEKWSGLMKDAGFAITMQDDPNLACRKTSLPWRSISFCRMSHDHHRPIHH